MDCTQNPNPLIQANLSRHTHHTHTCLTPLPVTYILHIHPPPPFPPTFPPRAQTITYLAIQRESTVGGGKRDRDGFHEPRTDIRPPRVGGRDVQNSIGGNRGGRSPSCDHGLDRVGGSCRRRRCRRSRNTRRRIQNCKRDETHRRRLAPCALQPRDIRGRHGNAASGVPRASGGHAGHGVCIARHNGLPFTALQVHTHERPTVNVVAVV